MVVTEQFLLSLTLQCHICLLSLPLPFSFSLPSPLSLPFFHIHTHSPQEFPNAEKMQLFDREAMDDSLPPQFYPGRLRSRSILPEPLGLSLWQNHHIWRAGGVVNIGRYTDRYWLLRTSRWIGVHLLTTIILISASNNKFKTYLCMCYVTYLVYICRLPYSI